jgi:anti-sigma B factor antagonist
MVAPMIYDRPTAESATVLVGGAAPAAPDGAVARAAVVRACGELDLATGDGLRERLAEALGAHPAVTVDLSGVEFIDCSGLRALTAARRHARRSGSRLVLSRPSPAVRRLLDLTRLAEHFEIEA